MKKIYQHRLPNLSFRIHPTYFHEPQPCIPKKNADQCNQSAYKSMQVATTLWPLHLVTPNRRIVSLRFAIYNQPIEITLGPRCHVSIFDILNMKMQVRL